MSRYKHYLDIDVVTAARQRINHIFDNFDHVVVMFSGGKDSLVCVHLALEEARKRGKLPLDVVFRDEELIPDYIVDFVDQYRRHDDLNLHWMAVPMVSHKFILGHAEPVTFWDNDREWMRPKPPWAITLPPDDGREFKQDTMDKFMYEHFQFKGLVAYITGVRAAESIFRYRSVVNKLNENYINASSYKAVKLCKPIYDWQENDVMKWLYENNIDWCEAYDRQHLTSLPLRVSTPLHAEKVRLLDKVAACSPEFYQRLVEVFPDVEIQARYGNDVDKKKIADQYLKDGLRGCVRYVRERINNPKSQRAAMGLIKQFGELRANNPEMYQVKDLLRHLIGGKYHRMPVPSGVESQIDGDAKMAAKDV